MSLRNPPGLVPVVPVDQPPYNAETVTPSDSVDLVNACNALWVGVAGHIKVTMEGAPGDAGAAVVLKNVPAGRLDIRVTRVWSTGTTATDIVALR